MSESTKWIIAVLIYVIGFPVGMYLFLLPIAWIMREWDRDMQRQHDSESAQKGESMITRHGTPEDIERVKYRDSVPIRLGEVRRRYRAVCDAHAPKIVRDAFLRRIVALSHENRWMRRHGWDVSA